MNLSLQEIARFNSKMEVTQAGCHIWQGPLDKDGYGTFFFRRANRRAHRVGWYAYRGEIPEGMVVNHKCGNRACVNHQHLETISVKENALTDSRSIAALNSRKTHCKNGHPLDKQYGKQRYCSVCSKEKQKRLREKWRAEDPLRGKV